MSTCEQFTPVAQNILLFFYMSCAYVWKKKQILSHRELQYIIKI